MFRIFWVIAVIIVVTGSGLLAARLLKSNVIEILHPVYGPAVQAVYATGTVEATVTVPIAPRITAKLIKLYFDEGNQVKKGDVLAQFDDEDVQQSLNKLAAQEEFAHNEYMRHLKLFHDGAVSKSTFERTRSDWEAIKADIAKTKVQLDFLKLTAPEDGFVIKREGEVGQVINASQPIFWLSCCAPLRISTEVDEEDISLVKPGQKVLIRADAFPDKIYHGEVETITPMGDPVARSYRVRINFMEDTPLLIGMTAETNIIIRETQKALLVPTSAVQNNKIWLVRDGRLKLQEVEIGSMGQQQVEILSGIGAKDLVVSKPDNDLKEDHKVRYKIVN